MSNFTMGDLARLLVVVVVTVGATILAYIGRVDAQWTETLYFAMAAYVFGYAHGATANGGPKAGG